MCARTNVPPWQLSHVFEHETDQFQIPSHHILEISTQNFNKSWDQRTQCAGGLAKKFKKKKKGHSCWRTMLSVSELCSCYWNFLFSAHFFFHLACLDPDEIRNIYVIWRVFLGGVDSLISSVIMRKAHSSGKIQVILPFSFYSKSIEAEQQYDFCLFL